MVDAEELYTDRECENLFASLFPNGFAGEDVLAEIAPEGGHIRRCGSFLTDLIGIFAVETARRDQHQVSDRFSRGIS